MVPERFSVSQLTTYLMCPRKWSFRYLEHREPEFRSVDLVFGSAIHSAIEWWWRKRMEGEAPEHAEVMRTFRADWHAELSTGNIRLNGKTATDLIATGEMLLACFVERFQDVIPEAVEERFEKELHDPRTGEVLPTVLVGYLDYRLGTTVGEIKTVSRKTEPLAQWEMQLSAYSFAQRNGSTAPQPVQVAMLVKTKVPKLEVKDIEVTTRHEDWFLEVASVVLAAIGKEVFPPIPSWACGSCEYRRACRGWR